MYTKHGQSRVVVTLSTPPLHVRYASGPVTTSEVCHYYLLFGPHSLYMSFENGQSIKAVSGHRGDHSTPMTSPTAYPVRNVAAIC